MVDSGPQNSFYRKMEDNEDEEDEEEKKEEA